MKIIHIFYSFVLLLVFTSCNNTLNEPKFDTSEVGQLSFSINMTNAPSDVYYLKGNLSNEDQDTVEINFIIDDGFASALVEDLKAGKWHLQVDAFNAQDVVIYSGSTDLNVLSGRTTPVQLQLNPATGSIKITITWGDYENHALDFDGIDDMAVVYRPNAMLTGLSSEITMEGWIYVRSYPSIAPRIIDRSDNGHAAPYADRFLLALFEPEHCIHININGYVAKSDSIGLNQWMHVAGTYDGQLLKVYVNGELANSTYVGTRIDVTESSLYVGNNASNTRQFDGLIRSLRIWNKALSPDNIRQINEYDVETINDNVISYWQFNEGEGQIVHDWQGSNNLQLGTTSEIDENDPQWIVAD